jgi:hypothetical protein
VFFSQHRSKPIERVGPSGSCVWFLDSQICQLMIAEYICQSSTDPASGRSVLLFVLVDPGCIERSWT